MKITKYKVAYPLCGIIPLVTATLLLYLLDVMDLFYSICFGILAGATGLVLARVVMHLIDGDNDPKTWQITIYALVAIGGWVGAIFAETWGWTSLFMCMVASGLLMTFATRFLKDEDRNGIPDIFEGDKKVTAQYCYEHMLFALVDDKLGNEPDHKRPLCEHGGQAYSVKEATEAGLTELAEAGKKYIDSLFDKA